MANAPKKPAPKPQAKPASKATGGKPTKGIGKSRKG